MIHPLIVVIVILRRLILDVQRLEKAAFQLMVKGLLLLALFLGKQVCQTAVDGVIDKTSLYLLIAALLQQILPDS